MMASDPGMSFLRAALATGRFDRGPVDPLRRMDGETLPRGTFRNFQGLLVRGAVSFTLTSEDQNTVATEIPFFEEHVVIACLVEGNFQNSAGNSWWHTLQELAKPGVVNFHRRVGQNFAYVRTDGKDTTDRILSFALHKFEGGAVFYQRWSRGFNPRMPLGVIWPTWITFPDLPLEFHKLARRVAEQVGQVLAESQDGSFDSPPRFCVGVDIRHGWVSNVIGFSEAGGSASIAVHYEAIELNCNHSRHHQHPTSACRASQEGILPGPRMEIPGQAHRVHNPTAQGPRVSQRPPRESGILLHSILTGRARCATRNPHHGDINDGRDAQTHRPVALCTMPLSQMWTDLFRSHANVGGLRSLTYSLKVSITTRQSTSYPMCKSHPRTLGSNQRPEDLPYWQDQILQRHRQ